MSLQLVRGNLNFSASSLRPWLLLKEFDLPFEEIAIDLFKPDTAQKLGPYSPSLKVPVLLHDDLRIWDSLAICEYISETFLEGRGWPFSTAKRAAARAIAAELHADFRHFNRDWPMNCQVKIKLKPSEQVEEEIARLDAIMANCRRKYGQGGDYLFGSFSIVDCMFAPYALALQAYGAVLTAAAREYLEILLDNPHLQCWIDDAQDEIEEFTWEKVG